MNKIIILGRLVKDPETSEVNGKKLCKFSIAETSHGRDSFFNCSAWQGTADLISKGFKKGDRILIYDAYMTQYEYEKDGKKQKSYGVTVNEFNYIENKIKDIKGSEEQPDIDNTIPF